MYTELKETFEVPEDGTFSIYLKNPYDLFYNNDKYGSSLFNKNETLSIITKSDSMHYDYNDRYIYNANLIRDKIITYNAYKGQTITLYYSMFDRDIPAESSNFIFKFNAGDPHKIYNDSEEPVKSKVIYGDSFITPYDGYFNYDKKNFYYIPEGYKINIINNQTKNESKIIYEKNDSNITASLNIYDINNFIVFSNYDTLESVVIKLNYDEQTKKSINKVFIDNSLSAFPETGEAGKIYIAKDTNKAYKWSGSSYTEILTNPIPRETFSLFKNNLLFFI